MNLHVPEEPENQEVLRSLTRELLAHTWAKLERGETLARDEEVLGAVLRDHAEYARFWPDPGAAVAARFGTQDTNPFLHVHLHLVVEGQLAAHDPPEVAELFTRRTAIGDSRHEICHQVMNALAAAIWDMMQARGPFDVAAYRRRLRKL